MYNMYPPPWWPGLQQQKDPMDQFMKFMRWQEAKEKVKEKKQEEEKKKKNTPPTQSMDKATALGLTLALTPILGSLQILFYAYCLRQTITMLNIH